MTKVKLRNIWFQVHKWIGIVLAVVFIPLTLTGSALVWEQSLDRMLQPSHYAAAGPTALPASAYIAVARHALPAGSKIISLSIGKGPVMVTAMPPRPSRMRGPPLRLAAWVDPASGKLIDSGMAISPVLRWAHIFHGSLQLPASGRAVVGWLGMALLLSSLTGLWLWWPLSGNLIRGLRWRRQPALDGNLHHLVGFWMALPLAILSLTGVIIAWPQMTGSSGGMRRSMAVPVTAPHLTVDQVLSAASVQTRAVVLWPTDKDAKWTVEAGRAATVKIDDATGAIILGSDGDRGVSRPLYRRLHDGTNMGLPWQIVIFLAGAAPSILGITGVLMWLRTRRWRGRQGTARASD